MPGYDGKEIVFERNNSLRFNEGNLTN